MDAKTARITFVELVGAFGLVFFSAGLVCINQTTTPEGAAGTSPLTLHQPGIVGVALGQGLILAALLGLTVPISGGYLNPAIALMLWVFGKLETPRAAWLIGAQFVGGLLAAVCLNYTFDASLLKSAHFGAPHMNPLAYPAAGQSLLATGTAIELLLTFFLVTAIFSLAGADTLRLGLVAGMIATVCALFGFALTGAALNPARWLGPALLDALTSNRYPWGDSLIYLAGPILGALLGGAFVFKIVRQAPG
jgi:aquaporin TIP